MEHLKYKCRRYRRKNKNAFARYNRKIRDNFASAHSNLPSFISTITTEFLYYSERSTEIMQNSSGIVYQSERFQMPEIDQCYISWKQNQT
ncbi:hypothetical protein MXB_2905 [Myxobolus squamalis]|nr:hypothetical protein MXB_2905 [Myxobolus squamalis]